MEGESKRIGKVVLPGFIVEKKEAATQIFIEMPIEERVQHIIEDYKPFENQQDILHAFKHIKNRIHTPIAKEIETSLQEQHYENAVRLLLIHYYDPRYEHAMKQYEQDRVVIKAGNRKEAVEAVKNYLSEL